MLIFCYFWMNYIFIVVNILFFIIILFIWNFGIIVKLVLMEMEVDLLYLLFVCGMIGFMYCELNIFLFCIWKIWVLGCNENVSLCMMNIDNVNLIKFEVILNFGLLLDVNCFCILLVVKIWLNSKVFKLWVLWVLVWEMVVIRFFCFLM